VIVAATVALALALATDIFGHWSAGLRPADSAYAAMVYMNTFLQLELIAALIVMAAFAIARRLAGRLSGQRPVVFDNLSLLWHYTVAQALLGLLLVHGAPHLLN
jgi:cytochrome c oxidase subunit I+III